MLWQVPRKWGGRPAFLLAGGPSLGPALADGRLERLRELQAAKRCKVIAINKALDLAPWAEVLFAGDGRFFEWERSRRLPTFTGRYMVTGSHELRGPKWAHVHELRWDRALAYSRTPSTIAGACSGGMAMNVAALFGAGREILVGFDFRRDDKGREHWHDGHRDKEGKPVPSKTSNWSKFRKAIERMGPHLQADGIEVVNVNPSSALRCFPFVELDKELDL